MGALPGHRGEWRSRIRLSVTPCEATGTVLTAAFLTGALLLAACAGGAFTALSWALIYFDDTSVQLTTAPLQSAVALTSRSMCLLFQGRKYSPQHDGNEWQQDENDPQMLHDPAGDVYGVC